MPRFSTTCRIAGVFYPVAILLASSLAFAERERPDFHALERATRAAYESVAPTALDDFERSFEALTHAYRTHHRTQELAWAHHAYDFTAEGARIERALIAEMRGDEPVTVARLTSFSARVFLATYASGNRAVFVGTDHRLHGAPVDPREDERRNLILAYEISRSARLHIVPAATFATLEDERGVRKFVARAHIADLDWPSEGHEHRAYVDERLHVLDFLMGQVDRNRTGFGYRPGGDVVALDNRRVLNFMDLTQLDGLADMPSMRPPRWLSDDVRSGLKNLRKDLSEGAGKHFAYLTFAELQKLLKNIDVLERIVARTPCEADLRP